MVLLADTLSHHKNHRPFFQGGQLGHNAFDILGNQEPLVDELPLYILQQFVKYGYHNTLCLVHI